MKTYTVTEKPFDEKLTTTRGMVYTVVKSAGANGITRDEIARKVDGLMVLSGAYHRLNDLVKDGFVVVSGAPSRPPKPWATPPDSWTPAPGAEERFERAREDDRLRAQTIVLPWKWRCPTCNAWVREEIGKSCKSCREKVTNGGTDQQEGNATGSAVTD